VTAYVIRRVLWGILMLIVVCLTTFIIFRVLPTVNPAELRAGRNPTPESLKAIEHSLRLDRSLPTQFYDYLREIVLHFNFGYSYGSNESVTSLIKERLPATISLTVGAAVLWIVFGIGIGVLSALRRHSYTDRGAMGGALLLVSAPEFWLGLVLLFLFSSSIGKFKILPGAGSYVGLTSDPWKWFTSLLMPWFVLAAGSAAVFARLIRGNLLEVMDEDYIRTARAKGLPEKRVVRQGVRASINPVVTLMGLEFGVLLGGAVLVETVFNIPGVGRLAYESISSSDYEVIEGTVLLAAMFIIVANIVVDIVYAFIDPRVRYA
jgi:peptide/nickel transport system permease protein